MQALKPQTMNLSEGKPLQSNAGHKVLPRQSPALGSRDRPGPAPVPPTNPHGYDHLRNKTPEPSPIQRGELAQGHDTIDFLTPLGLIRYLLLLNIKNKC